MSQIPNKPQSALKYQLRQPLQRADNLMNQMDQTPLGGKRKAVRYDKNDSPYQSTVKKQQRGTAQTNNKITKTGIKDIKTNGMKPNGRANANIGKNQTKIQQVEQDFSTFEELQQQTGKTVNDILEKKLTFQKRDLADKKLKLLQPYLKELRVVSQYLHLNNVGKDQEIADFIKSQEDLVQQNQVQKAFQLDLQVKANIKINELKRQVDEKSRGITLQEAQIASLKSEQAKLQQEIQSSTSTNKNLNTKISSLESKALDLTDKIDKAQQLLQQQQKNNQESLEQYNKHYQNLQTYNNQCSLDLEAKKQEISQLQADKASIIEEKIKIVEQFQDLKSESKTKFKELDEIRIKYEESQRLHLEFSAKSSQLQQDCDKLYQERDELKQQLLYQQQAKSNLEQSSHEQLERLKEVARSKGNLALHCDNQQDVMDNMRREVRLAQAQADTSDQLAKQRKREIDELKEYLEASQNKLQSAENKIEEQEIIRRKLHNVIQELKGNVRVFARVRPQLESEQDSVLQDGTQLFSYPQVGDTQDQGLEVITPPGSNLIQQQGRGQSQNNKYQFQFDKVFTPAAQQEEIFDEISQLVQSALDGYKVCIFAYGQTGSGKTYTMMGQEGEVGIIPRAIEQIFKTSQRMKNQGWSFNMKAHMLEIYNEDIQDLLAKTDASKKHTILHDPSGTTVSDIQLFDVNTPEKLTHLLGKAMQKRAVGATAINQRSSRSHMVFTLKIEGRNNSTDQNVKGVLNLIDLAGSERLKESQATGIRMKEAQYINKSLSSLGDVISALASKSEHVPYRNSKLTYLLMQCLGGDAKTLMFVNISCSSDNINESLNSLRFATKVNSCEIGTAKRNTK